MPLEINPTPDTLIRIMIKFEGRKENKDILQQKLEIINKKDLPLLNEVGQK